MDKNTILMNIASSMSWALCYSGVMGEITFQNGESLKDQVKRLSPPIPHDEAEIANWRIQYGEFKEQVKSMIEDHVMGSNIRHCYSEWCGIFYNGSEDDHMFWAEDAGFDPGPRSDDEDYDDLTAYRELAFEYIHEIMATLDWDSIPKEWLVDALRKNEENQQGEFSPC